MIIKGFLISYEPKWAKLYMPFSTTVLMTDKNAAKAWFKKHYRNAKILSCKPIKQ